MPVRAISVKEPGEARLARPEQEGEEGVTTATISLEKSGCVREGRSGPGGGGRSRGKGGDLKGNSRVLPPCPPLRKLPQSLYVHGLSQGFAPPTEMTLFPVAFWSISAVL